MDSLVDELRRLHNEHELADRERFESLHTAIGANRDRIVRLEDRLHVIEDLADAMDAELGGVPRREARDPKRVSLRDRVHAIENDRVTAVAAKAAVDALIESRQDAKARGWGIYQKTGLFIFAGGAFIMGILKFWVGQ